MSGSGNRRKRIDLIARAHGLSDGLADELEMGELFVVIGSHEQIFGVNEQFSGRESE
jgi:hypothetical protein